MLFISTRSKLDWLQVSREKSDCHSQVGSIAERDAMRAHNPLSILPKVPWNRIADETSSPIKRFNRKVCFVIQRNV